MDTLFSGSKLLFLFSDFNKEALKYVPFIQVDPEVLDPNYVKPEEVVEEAEDIKIPPTNHEELEVVIPAKPIATGNRKPSDVKVVTIKTVNNPEEDSRSNCDNKNIELNRSAYNRESNRIQSRYGIIINIIEEKHHLEIYRNKKS